MLSAGFEPPKSMLGATRSMVSTSDYSLNFNE